MLLWSTTLEQTSMDFFPVPPDPPETDESPEQPQPVWMSPPEVAAAPVTCSESSEGDRPTCKPVFGYSTPLGCMPLPAAEL